MPLPSPPTYTGADVLRIRKELGLTQDDFAELLGYSRGSYVSEIEKGRRSVEAMPARLLGYIERHGLPGASASASSPADELRAIASGLAQVAARIESAASTASAASTRSA